VVAGDGAGLGGECRGEAGGRGEAADQGAQHGGHRPHGFTIVHSPPTGPMSWPAMVVGEVKRHR
jgi:hypothetical protein